VSGHKHPSIAAARLHSRNNERDDAGRFLCARCDTRIEHGTPGGYLNWRCRCRPCTDVTTDTRREYARSPKRRAYGTKVARKRRGWLTLQKMGKSCVDCGLMCTEDNFPAFNWDHRPGSDKVCSVSQLVARTSKRDRLLAEISKCDLRCANCHRVMTWRRNLEEETCLSS
jgi:hypothetical protein